MKLKYLFILLILLSCRGEHIPISFHIAQGQVALPESDIATIKKNFSEIVRIIESGKTDHLEDYVSEKKGIYIDLKSHKSKKQFIAELKKKNGYIENFFYNTESLRKYTDDATQISVKDLFLKSSSLKVDIYIESPTECEMKLHLEDESQSFRLNQPVMIKEDNKWYIYRLF